MKKRFVLIITSIALVSFIILFILYLNTIKRENKISDVSNRNSIDNNETIIINNKTIIPKHFVVVKVMEKYLGVISADNKEKYNVLYSNEGNIGFKQGQEILVYSTQKTIASISPATINEVKEIRIIKEKSDISISDDVLRYYYSSRNNVEITIDSISNKSMTLSIIDNNEYPYKYLDSYSISHKVKNKDYTGIGYQIGENTETTTAGFSRNWFGIYITGIRPKIKYKKRRYSNNKQGW